MKSIIIFLLISIFVVEARLPRIEGGKPEKNIRHFPWIVFIKIKLGTWNEHHCTGSIIGSRYILTAAQCVFPGKMSDVAIITGMLFDFIEGMYYSIKEYRIHPKYPREGWSLKTYQGEHNIAVLKTTKDIKFFEKVQKIDVEFNKTLNGSNTFSFKVDYGKDKLGN